MTEQAGVEDYAINVNFEGHHPEDITLQQVVLGYSPSLLLTVSQDDEAVNFDIDVYGTEDIRGFLDTVKAVIDTLLERDLTFKTNPEAGVPGEETDSEADSES